MLKAETWRAGAVQYEDDGRIFLSQFFVSISIQF